MRPRQPIPSLDRQEEQPVLTSLVAVVAVVAVVDFENNRRQERIDWTQHKRELVCFLAPSFVENRLLKIKKYEFTFFLFLLCPTFGQN